MPRTRVGRVVEMLLVALSIAPLASAQTTFTQFVNQAIPDNACIANDLLLNQGGLMTDLDIGVQIDHPFRSDLELQVGFRAFDQQIILYQNLAVRHDGSTDNYYATFDSDAATSCSSVCLDTTCSSAPGPTCRPDGSLDVYDGRAARGFLSLVVCDDAAMDVGTLVSWSVTIRGLSMPLDIDGNGVVNALTDGLLTLRYHFGFRGDALIGNAVAPDCKRCTAPEIEAFLAAP